MSSEQWRVSSGEWVVSGEPCTMFQIQTTKGIDIRAFSAIQAEDEVLLPAACVLTITGVAKLGNGLTMITCEEDAKAPPLIK